MSTQILRQACSVIVLCACLSVPRASAAEVYPIASSDSSDVVATIARFHGALANGDSASALALMANDALIIESGAVETRAEYRAHHLPADIEFARAVRSMRTVTRVAVQGDVAWVVSTSTTQGQVNGRAVNSMGSELTVLRRAAAGWQIAAVHCRRGVGDRLADSTTHMILLRIEFIVHAFWWSRRCRPQCRE